MKIVDKGVGFFHFSGMVRGRLVFQKGISINFEENCFLWESNIIQYGLYVADKFLHRSSFKENGIHWPLYDI